MPKFNEKGLCTIPEAQPLKNNVINTLSRLKEENAGNLDDKKIKISFEFFDSNNKYFSLGNIENEWFTDLLEELKELSKITRKQLFTEYKKKYKPHPYISNISSLNYKDEYLTNPQYEGVQIRLEKSSGRIHGFFIENVYYIRFLDRRHNMYNSEGYGGVTFVPFPKTGFEKLEDENQKQRQKIQNLENKIEHNVEILCQNCMECKKEIYNKFEL